MTRQPRRFTQADIAKILKAGTAAGITTTRVEIQPDGTISATFSSTEGPRDPESGWDERIAGVNEERRFSQLAGNRTDALSATERLMRRVKLRQQREKEERQKAKATELEKANEARALARYGVDTAGMSEAERRAAYAMHAERWKTEVRRSPLDKRERLALAKLYELRGRQAKHNEIKGAGPGTCERLEARNYALLEMKGSRFIGWQITDRGIAAYEAGSLPGF